MITHRGIWRAIDRIAQDRGLTASGLARAAKLDATTFNPSKRVSPDGKKRWPSTETVGKVLNHVRLSMARFCRIVDRASREDGRGRHGAVAQPGGDAAQQAHNPPPADPSSIATRRLVIR